MKGVQNLVIDAIDTIIGRGDLLFPNSVLDFAFRLKQTFTDLQCCYVVKVDSNLRQRGLLRPLESFVVGQNILELVPTPLPDLLPDYGNREIGEFWKAMWATMEEKHQMENSRCPELKMMEIVKRAGNLKPREVCELDRRILLVEERRKTLESIYGR